MHAKWIADVVGRMHVAGITGIRLAKECGYSNNYVSLVLKGKKGTDQTRQRIEDALVRLEQADIEETSNDED